MSECPECDRPTFYADTLCSACERNAYWDERDAKVQNDD